MAKHPAEYGFIPGLKIRISTPAVIEPLEGAKLADVVYVALLGNKCLKVGESGRRLIDRWQSIATIFGSRALKPNEQEDRRRWLDEAKDQMVEVWVKAAKQIPSDFIAGKTLSARHAEEIELDDIYEPSIGRALKLRRERLGEPEIALSE